MINILIPSDFSAMSHSAVLYSLYLMRGRECNFYFIIDPYKQKFVSRQSPGSEELECLHFAIQQEVSALRKKVEKFFPNEKFKLCILDFSENLREIPGPVSLTILNYQLAEPIFSTFYQQLLKKVRTPLLYIPPGTVFTTPKKILLKLSPGIMVKKDILIPLKELYGNHSFSLKIHKFYSGTVDEQDEIVADHKLREIFDIYHPVIKIFNSKDYGLSIKHDELQKADLQLLPLSKKYIKRKMGDTGFINSLSNLENPLLIIPGIEKEHPDDYKRFRKNRNSTSLPT